MKKSMLIIGAIVPVVVGYAVNRLLMVPFIGGLSFIILPLPTTAFWAYLGCQCARSSRKLLPSSLDGNSVGILSLLVYIWQFLFQTDKSRNIFLAAVSQMFSAAVPTYLLGRIAMLFESEPNFVGRRAMLALQVLSLVYMMAIFACGYLWGKRKQKL